MTSKQKEVLRKIMYAVETGGQVYGQARYNDFTEAYTNSSNEHAITIGAGAWYAGEAQHLLKNILAADPGTFREKDVAGVEKDIKTADWSCYRISKSSEKAKSIQNIISSASGVRCQDSLMDEQMEIYIKEAEALGVIEADAQCMCANFRHQGGYSAMKRVLEKTSKPYTLDNIYNACRTDTGNQVGAYRARQTFVYNSLKNNLKGESSMNYLNNFLSVLAGWLGYNEAAGTDDIIIKLYNDQRLPGGYKMAMTDAWCQATQSAAAYKAGINAKNKEQNAPNQCSCYYAMLWFKNNGLWTARGAAGYNPQVGDWIYYDWDGNGVPDHVGCVVERSGNTIIVREGNYSDSVKDRTLSIYSTSIEGYGRMKGISGEAGKAEAKVSYKGTVTASALNVRSAAGMFGTVIKTVSRNTMLEFTKECNGWGYSPTVGGWVSLSYIQRASLSDTQDIEEETQAAGYKTVNYKVRTTTALNCRKTPSGAYIKTFTEGTQLTITKTNSDASWLYCGEGWVCAKYTEKVTTGFHSWVGRVTASTLNVRTWAGTEYPLIKSWPQLAKGNLVDVTGELKANDGSTWYKVLIDKRITGFVSGAYIARN